MAEQPTKILHLIGDNGALENEEAISNFIQQEIAVAGNNTNSTKEADGEDSKTSRSGSDDSYEMITSPSQVGLNYRVIGVFGGQSSGKSTLLNRLFQTKFDTMDSNKGRQQTTKGAFLSKAPVGNNNIFVMDFEGTDGVERGEDQSFERQLSLFALSCADTLIVNMWCHEVGRFNGANLALLRTVFEVNLQLFSHVGEDGAQVDNRDKERPTLLFVLRDWDGSQTKDALFSSVGNSLDTVWEKVTKPKQFVEAALADLFDIKYEALPHFNFQKEQFGEACEKLKSNFIDPASKGYMFKSAETFRGVPMEALPQYLTSCWESIKESKDLNIPSQRQMLAQVRCGEAAANAIKTFKDDVGTPFHDRIKKHERIPVLNKTLEDKMAELLEGYTKSTKLYAGPVATKHEEELRKTLEVACAKLVSFQCRQIATEEMEQCEHKVQKVLDVAIKGLHQAAEQCCEEEKEQTKDGGKYNWEEANNTVVANFWEAVRSGIDDLVDDLTRVLSAKGEGKNSAILNADPEGLSRVLLLLKEAADKKIQARVEALAADPQAAMTKQFEHALDQDPKTGSPRTFRSKAVLEKAYKPAAHCGVLLLSCLFASRLSKPRSADSGIFLGVAAPTASEQPTYPSDALQRLAAECDATVEDADLCDAEDESKKKPSVAVVLSKEAVSRAYEMYTKECTFTFRLRLQQIDTGSKALPAWVYGALLFLGFNEAYYAITNPLVLIVLIIVGYFFLQNFFIDQWGVLEEKAPGVALMLKAGWAQAEPHVAVVKAAFHDKFGGTVVANTGTAAPTAGGPARSATRRTDAKSKKED